MKKEAVLLKSTSVVIRRLRQQANYSQEELAAKSELTRSMIDKIERRVRMPSLETLIKIASAFDKKGSELVILIEQELEKKEGD